MQAIHTLEATYRQARRPRLAVGDAIATGLGAAAATVFIATIRGWDWPVLGSYRLATLVLATIGIGMCIAGGMQLATSPVKGAFFRTETFFGFVALTLTIAGVATGAKVAFIALAATMSVLWAVTTLGHALGRD